MIWEYEITPVCVRIEDIRNRKGILIMKKEVLDYVVEKTHDMMEAFSCSAEAKAPDRHGWMQLEQRTKRRRQRSTLQSLRRISCLSII